MSMKFFALIFSSFLLFNSGAPLAYSDVVTVENVSKDVLYSRAQVWFGTTFTEPKGAILVQDYVTGTISARGQYVSRYLKNMYGVDLKDYPCYTHFKLSVYVKDGRYKYEFSEFIEQCSSKNDPGVGLLTDSESYDGDASKKKYFDKVWGETKSAAESIKSSLVGRLNAALNLPDTNNQDW